MVIRVLTNESELRAVRQQVRTFVEFNEGSEEVTSDIELAVSELATNVMQHSDAETVTVAMTRLDEGWQIDVSDADEIPPLDSVTAPPTESITGRGLFIVQSVMDEVKIVQSDSCTVIRCLKRDA